MNLRLSTLVLAALASGSAIAAPYQILDLGQLPNGDGAYAFSVDSAGNVAGYGSFPVNGCDNVHAVVFSRGRVVDVSGPLGPGSSSEATGVNPIGDVIGLQNGSQPFLISNGVVINPNTIPGTVTSSVARINSSGTFVGQVGIYNGTSVAYHAYEFKGGHMIDLNPLLGGAYSEAHGINDAGEVVGLARNAQGRWMTFLITGDPSSPLTQVVDLGNLGGSNATPYAINRHGDVAGGSYVASGAYHPFLVHNGQMQDLGLLPGCTGGCSMGLNSSQTVVGYQTVAGGASIPFVYLNGVLHNANDLVPASGWTIASVTDVNDRGQIVGTGTVNGITRAFMMIPTPVYGVASSAGH